MSGLRRCQWCSLRVHYFEWEIIKFAKGVGRNSHKEHSHIRIFAWKGWWNLCKASVTLPTLRTDIWTRDLHNTKQAVSSNFLCPNGNFLLACFTCLQPWTFMVTRSYFTNSYRQNHHTSKPARCSHLSPRMFVQLAYTNSTTLGWVFLFFSILCKPYFGESNNNK